MVSEDLSLLYTDYVPSPYELTLVNARIKEQRQELRSIDVKITSLEEQLKGLRLRRESIHKSYSVAQALVAPIRRLPLKILKEIFVQAVPRFHLDRLESDTSEDPLDASDPHPHHVRWALRGVCRRWREVADATPSVWSTIALDHRLPDDTGVLECWLSQSETELIDLYMQPSAWSESLDTGRFQDVLSLIRSHLPRIRLFVAHLRHYRGLADFTLTLTDIFPASQVTEAPNMEVFGIIGDLGADSHEIVGDIRAPKLSSLILLDSETTIRSFASDSLRSLQKLTMSLLMSPSASYLDILAQCSKLRYLHWTDYSDKHQHPATTGPDVSVSLAAPLFPLLVSLTLRVEVSAVTLPLFRHFRGSILDSISVDASPATDSRPHALDALTSLLNEEMMPHLHQLMLMRASVGPGMAGILVSLPNLTALHVYACHLETTFFSALVREGHTSPTLVCPRLETLCISSSRFCVSDLAIFLRHHVESDNAEPLRSSGCLTCVEIMECYDILEEDDRAEASQLLEEYEHVMNFS